LLKNYIERGHKYAIDLHHHHDYHIVDRLGRTVLFYWEGLPA
jgi:hypothetical protein